MKYIKGNSHRLHVFDKKTKINNSSLLSIGCVTDQGNFVHHHSINYVRTCIFKVYIQVILSKLWNEIEKLPKKYLAIDKNLAVQETSNNSRSNHCRQQKKMHFCIMTTTNDSFLAHILLSNLYVILLNMNFKDYLLVKKLDSK